MLGAEEVEYRTASQLIPVGRTQQFNAWGVYKCDALFVNDEDSVRRRFDQTSVGFHGRHRVYASAPGCQPVQRGFFGGNPDLAHPLYDLCASLVNTV